MVKVVLLGKCPVHHVKGRQADITTMIHVGPAVCLVVSPRATMAEAMLSVQLTRTTNGRATK